MLKSKFITSLLAYIFIFSTAQANSYLRKEDLNNINYGCFVEEQTVVFCTDKKIEDPDIIIRLPLLEPIKLANNVKAYRIMATIENNTKRNLSGARVNVSFGEEKQQSVDLLISEKIIYKQTSSIKNSHLIRSDIPVNVMLFNEINKVYLDADLSNVKIKIIELIFDAT